LAFVVRLLVRTYRVEVLGPAPPADGPVVFALPHGRQMGLLCSPRPARIAVLASLSRDGSIQTAVLRRLGFEVARGSTSRGGAAGLAAMVRAVRAGASVAIAVDGPRGPAGIAKPGAPFVAAVTHARLVPITCAASCAIVLRRSWDRFAVPAPFARVVVVRGVSCAVDPRSRADRFEAICRELEATLERLTEVADAAASHRSEQRPCEESH
jgi:hypothetical protein